MYLCHYLEFTTEKYRDEGQYMHNSMIDLASREEPGYEAKYDQHYMSVH